MALTRFFYFKITDTVTYICLKSSKNPNGNKPAYNSFGVSFAVNKNRLIIVNSLIADSLSGLNLGERIIKINSMDVSIVNDEIFCEIKKMLNNSTIITLENESYKRFTIEKKNLLQLLN